MRARRRQSGQVLVLFALALPALLLMVGVIIDGSRLFQARLAVQTLADEAADAGAQQVDTGGGSAARAGAPPELVPGRGRDSAAATADAYLADRASDGRTTWSIAVQPRAITVTVERRVQLAFMPVAKLATQTVTAQSVAGPVSGIAGPGR